jgi:hypothetical protein
MAARLAPQPRLEHCSGKCQTAFLMVGLTAQTGATVINYL